MKLLAGLFGRIVAKLILVLPRFMQFWLGDFLAILWFDILRIRRQIVLDNLKIVFPEMSKEDRTKLGRKSMRNMCSAVVDYCYFHVLHKPKYKKWFELKGIEHYKAAKEKNKGICFLSMHLGNGDNGAAGLALHGIDVTIISKEFKLKWLNELWFGMRSKIGIEFIPPRNSSFAVLKALKKKKNVVFVNDQFMGPPVGIKTEFFGKVTGTAMGLAVMAQRSGAPVVPVSTYRRDDGVTVVEIEPEIPFDSCEGMDSDPIEVNTQKYNSWIEGRILKFPDQWMWVHRRWKEFNE